MLTGKEIRSKIKSVENTKQITRAMQMVSTSKMRKTQDKMRQSRPYADNIRRVISNLANANKSLQKESLLLRKPNDLTHVGVILITTDKGLCGGLNSNALRLYFDKVKNFKNNNICVETCTIGQKGFAASRRVGEHVISSAVGLGDVPRLDKLVGPLSILLKNFRNGKIDAVYIIYSSFVNTMKHIPTFEQLLPLQHQNFVEQNSHTSNYIFEPSPLAILDEFIVRYIESVVYQCLADNMASEQASRMIAMKSATDNADNVIKKLRLTYNKSRQAAITEEISEIVSGSAAI